MATVIQNIGSVEYRSQQKGAIMLVADAYTQFAMARAQSPPLTSGNTLHWDGMKAISWDAEYTPVSEPVAPAAVPTRDGGPLPSPSALAINWATEAACMTFYLDPELLLPDVHAVASGATGTLIWVHGKRDETCITPTVHPALLVHHARASSPLQYTELVPHLPEHDLLLHHMALVLQAAFEAEDVPGRLYAEALADALAVHLLSRDAIGRPHAPPSYGGLTPCTLHRTITYIQTHLEQQLSLSELAAVAQISPAHFSRLFKCATGKTPHQYVTTCRMEQAKRLLATTDMSLSDIGFQVGCADQSHFTALFRKYASTTPKTYRNTTMSLSPSL